MIAPASVLSRHARRPTAIALTLATTVLAVACGGAAEVVRPLTARGDVDAIFAEYDRPGSPGCALGVIQNGEFAYRRGYGEANLEHGIGLDADTVFRTGSVAKQFTGMLILLLDEAGTLSLDDDLRRWVPEMPDLGPITIRHLLHHSSGLRDYLVLTELAGYRDQDYYSAEQLLRLLGRQRALNFAPGDDFLYSNTGYFLLAQIAERAAGKGIEALGQELIFGPLGMQSSRYYVDTSQIVPRRATGYAPTPEGFAISATTLPIAGDGAVYTTVNDLLAWDRNFYSNRLGAGAPGLIEQWLAPGRLNDGSATGARNGVSYGAGIGVRQERGTPVVSHGGAFVGFRADIIRYPEHRTTVAVLCNLATADPSRLGREVAEVFLGEVLEPDLRVPGPASTTEPATADSEFSVPVSQLRQFRGRYVSRELGVTYSLEILDGRLMASLPQRWERSLAARDEDHFVDPESEIELVFSRNSGGAVDGFALNWGRVTGLWFERIG